MDQRVDRPTEEDLLRVEEQRGWVRGHFSPSSQHKYEALNEKVRLMQAILDAGWIERDETWKLQCLGITLGDTLVQGHGMEWVMVEDEFGRDPALRVPGTSVLLFPLTMISKRVERGEMVNVRELFDNAASTASEMAKNPKYRLD